jgi:hypothetical protein
MQSYEDGGLNPIRLRKWCRIVIAVPRPDRAATLSAGVERCSNLLVPRLLMLKLNELRDINCCAASLQQLDGSPKGEKEANSHVGLARIDRAVRFDYPSACYVDIDDAVYAQE